MFFFLLVLLAVPTAVHLPQFHPIYCHLYCYTCRSYALCQHIHSFLLLSFSLLPDGVITDMLYQTYPLFFPNPKQGSLVFLTVPHTVYADWWTTLVKNYKQHLRLHLLWAGLTTIL